VEWFSGCVIRMDKDKMEYDVIIIGAGPAGMNAAVYAARYRLKTLVFGEITGGAAAKAYEICNLLTYKKIRGFELSVKMKEQVTSLGVEIKADRVEKVSLGKFFEVKTHDKTYLAKKVIFACGTEDRKLEIDNEDKFIGRGISYCATCDAAFFKDKVVGVIGGNDAALTAALLLSEYAAQVYIIYRKDRFFRPEPAWVHLVLKNKKIKPIFNSNVVKLVGKEKLEAVLLDSEKNVKLDGLFIEIGSIPRTELAKDTGVKLEHGFIETDSEQKTNVYGVFAAGDVTNNALKQIITAAAEGAIAAKSAYDEILEESS